MNTKTPAMERPIAIPTDWPWLGPRSRRVREVRMWRKRAVRVWRRVVWREGEEEGAGIGAIFYGGYLWW